MEFELIDQGKLPTGVKPIKINAKTPGITEQVQQLSGDLAEEFELQADCLAGVWGFTLAQRGVLLGQETLTEATELLAEIGAERVSESVPGSLRPEDWGHATAEQRAEWFLRGYESGDPTQCDPFAGG